MEQLVRAFFLMVALALSTSGAAEPSKELLDAIAAGEHMKVLDALEKKDSNVRDTKDMGSGRKWTVLHFAVNSRRADMLQLFVQSEGIEVDARDEAETGWTALHLAASLGYENEVRRLLDLGADPRLTGELVVKMPVRPARIAVKGKAKCTVTTCASMMTRARCV